MDKGNTGPAPLPSPYKPGTKTQTIFNTTTPKFSPPAVVKKSPTPSPSYGGGGGGGGGYTGGGGAVGANATGQVSAAAPAPSIDAYLGADSGYQAQVAALNKALADYQAQMGVQTNQYNTNYAGNVAQLGQDRTQGLSDQQNDYTGRGLLHSGLYGKAAGDLGTQFDTRQADLSRARSDFLANLGLDFGNFKSEQNLTQTKAKQDAIARRAAQYGAIA